MSGVEQVRGAVIAALRGDILLMDRLNGLFDGAPGRASAPYAVVGDCQESEWGAKGLEGCELRLTISVQDAGETPARLAPLVARVGAVMAALGDAGAGWRVVTARLARSRIAKVARGQDGWIATIEYRVRAVLEA